MLTPSRVFKRADLMGMIDIVKEGRAALLIVQTPFSHFWLLLDWRSRGEDGDETLLQDGGTSSGTDGSDSDSRLQLRELVAPAKGLAGELGKARLPLSSIEYPVDNDSCSKATLKMM